MLASYTEPVSIIMEMSAGQRRKRKLPVEEYVVMKRIAMLVSLVAALVLSQTAAADNRSHRRGYDNFGSNFRYNSYSRNDYRNHNRYSRSYYSRNYRSYNPYHYNSRRGSSIHISYGNRYSRRHDHDAGYFVGGLVLGSLLSAPRYSPPVERVVYRSAPVVTQREVVVVNNPVSSAAPTSGAPVASGRRLLRDLEGNCFERIIDAEGNEIRVQLEAEECRF